jgi:hypothetical protein
VNLPFAPEQFFSVFADYNQQFVVVVVLWWLATVGALALVWREPELRSAYLSYFLGVLWVWNAVAYHAYLFTRINPAAWFFSALFVVQGLLFVWAGARLDVTYLSATRFSRSVGIPLVVYSLAYPFLTIAAGHRYPATPTFGLPCPTVILTIGLLLTVRERVPLTLAPIPIVWAFIGGSAAMLLNVRTDYALFAAGLVLLAAVLTQRMRTRLVVG